MTWRAEDPILPEIVMDRARKVFRLDQLEAQGFFGGWMHEAWVTRLVARRGLLFRESWIFHTSPADEAGVPDSDAWTDVMVLSRTRFAVPPDPGPVVMSDRTFGDRVTDRARWVARALQNAETLGADDGPPYRTELSDDTFWELIALLDGSLGEGAVDRLVAAMREWDYGAQIGYQETLDRKLFELDSPENTVGYVDDPVVVVDGEASLMYRCEIIAQGREAFALRVASPQRGTPGVDGTSTPEFLYVLEEISPYGMPLKTYPIATGSNPAYWPDAPPVRRPWLPPLHEVPSASPFSQRVQLESLDLNPQTAGSMYGFLAYAMTTTSIREVVGCAMAFTADSVRDEVRSILQSRLDPGGDASSDTARLSSSQQPYARGTAHGDRKTRGPFNGGVPLLLRRAGQHAGPRQLRAVSCSGNSAAHLVAPQV